MTNQDFLTSIAVILSLMGLLAIVETFVPLFARPANLPGRARANVAMTIQVFVTAFALNAGVAAAAVMLAPSSPRLFEMAGLPAGLQLLLGVVALDFAYGYVAHRTQHAWPALWRFHRVHHSDPFVDVTTGFRTHPVEVAWRYAWMLATVWLLGVPVASVVAFRMLSAVNGILEHANVRLPAALDTALSWVWVTPNMHKIHHSRRQAETDTNYGNLLPVYDRLLGTFVPTARASSVQYGLDDARPEDVRSFSAMLAMPWRRQRESPPPPLPATMPRMF
jgi:sterol desaturase/sphingolipid hydroxylase (fatty acid hydroxylase superfamily)